MKPETSYKAQKSALRAQIRQRRRDLDPIEKERMDSAVHLGLATLVSEVQPACVAAYWPFDGEPDIRPALNLLERQGIRIALPVIDTSSVVSAMKFRHWFSGAAMTNNPFGIPEPSGTAEVQLFEIDLVLLPLVGWDPFGARLGMGAGYYDRALQPFAQSDSPLRIGVAYQLQKVPRLPAESWDILLHGVVSESGWYECRTIV
jgi:5-formyltetrahydrofolate cyclo-ligase